MTAIDRAAIIEAAVQAVMARPAIVHHFTETEAYARDDLDAALPVIAAGLLAPLRAQSAEWREFMRDPDMTHFERSAIRGCVSELERLLDQIEADVAGGER